MGNRICPVCGKWPEILVGAGAVAGYLGMNIQVVQRMFREGRLPGRKDGKKRWMTSKSLLDRWIVASGAAQRESKSMRSPNAVRKGSKVEATVW